MSSVPSGSMPIAGFFGQDGASANEARQVLCVIGLGEDIGRVIDELAAQEAQAIPVGGVLAR